MIDTHININGYNERDRDNNLFQASGWANNFDYYEDVKVKKDFYFQTTKNGEKTVLTQDIFTDKSEIRGKLGDVVVAFADTSPTDAVMGQNIFKVIHQRSKEEIYVALEDLTDA